jgi:hypothetical protein
LFCHRCISGFSESEIDGGSFTLVHTNFLFISQILVASSAAAKTPVNEHSTSHEMEASRWCLYLPGICMHAVPASRRRGSGNLHLELNPFPAALKFQSIPPREAVVQDRAEALATTSSPSSDTPAPDIPARHPARMASAGASSSSGDTSDEEELMMLTDIEKAFENTSTSVAASQMRNALTALADTCKDPHQKEVSILFGQFRILRR